MDLLTLVTACALTVDPKLMHALVWHHSGGEPWAISMPGEANPRVYRNMRDAIRDLRESSVDSFVRVGLAGVPVQPTKVSASVLQPCRNLAKAAVQLTKLAARCKAHPRLKIDPNLCAVAAYRGSWDRPDIRFATEVAATAAKGDAPNFDMPRGTSTEIFDTAGDAPSDASAPVVDITTTFADQERRWSSALFPTKSKPPSEQWERTAASTPPATEPPSSASPASFLFKGNPQDRELFVRRIGIERPQ